MSTFLTSTHISACIEKLITTSRSNLFFISPYLKFSRRIKELLSSSDVPVTIVYGKQPMKSDSDQLLWIHSQDHISLYFYPDLHAKCYMNASNAIIASMNLYEFSQVNNLEMGVLLTKKSDSKAYQDCLDEVTRLIGSSSKVEKPDLLSGSESSSEYGLEKLTTSRLARNHKMTTNQALDRLVQMECLTLKGERHYLTDVGKSKGGLFQTNRHGDYFLWPTTIFD